MSTLEVPTWDPLNRRFETRHRCPYPDCGASIEPANAAESGALVICAACGRPYEVVGFQPTDASPIEIYRRPGIAFCTTTGQRLVSYSLLDWAEAGGGPGRSHSLDDPRGSVFGAPVEGRRVSIRSKFFRESIFDGKDNTRARVVDRDDEMRSVSVVRGRVVTATLRGRVSIFDAETGEPLLDRPLEWPDGSTNPRLESRSVRHPPAFRGSRMVLVAPHQAQFRNLKSFLLGGPQGDRRPRIVNADSGHEFFGAPLTVSRTDEFDDNWFALVQSRWEAPEIKDAKLVLYDLEGREIERVACEGLIRPPIFDRVTGWVIWICRDGSLGGFPAEQIGRLGDPLRWTPQVPLDLVLEDRPSFLGALDNKGRTELWVSNHEAGKAKLYRLVLDPTILSGAMEGRWQPRPLGNLHRIEGFSVGIDSPYADVSAGPLLGVATEHNVSSLERWGNSIAGVQVMSGRDETGRRGSWEAPLVCSVGILARLQGSLCLDLQNVQWRSASGEIHLHAPVPGAYEEPYGLAMLGRWIYVGQHQGLHGFEIVLEPEDSR